jgi:glycosyltransferase involved in cell wall biosynthesis
MGCDCTILLTGEATLKNAKRSSAVDFYKSYRRPAELRFIENFVVHKLPLRIFRNPLERRKENILAQSRKRVAAYIEEHGRPDFIFHHGVFDYCYLTSFLSKEFDLPVFYLENSPNLETDSFPCANPFDKEGDQRDFVRNVNRRFAVTQAYVNKMESLFGVPFEKCPNVLSSDFFIHMDEYQKDQNHFSFINIAILEPRKNQEMIIRAFASRFKGDGFYSLTIVGDGTLEIQLRKLAEDLGVGDQVTVLGFQGRSKIIELLDRSHCFVLGSHSETFGVVLIEAMARGIPCISTAIEGPLELVTPETGYFCKPNDVESMAAEMDRMVANYSDFNPQKIIESVRSRFGPEAVYSSLMSNQS